MKRFLPILIFIGISVAFFYQFFFFGKLPIPSDTIIGLYHPYRDLYAADYPNGIPYKNFLITDPVRQQYPWRELAVSQLKQGNLPIWNPYSFSGTPLLANFQTAAFYPLNILLFILPFSYGWSLLIFLQPVLAGIFMFYYLRYFNLKFEAALLGGITFAFGGFSVAWMEWNTIVHTALWLPLILLCIEKIFWYKSLEKNFQFSIFNFQFNRYVAWCIIFCFSLLSAFFAGHLQTFFYLFLISVLYIFIRWWKYGKNKKVLLLFTFCFSIFTVLTAIQWFPTLEFISLSARSIDQVDWQKEGWFIPWQHLIQFIAPDFFGNPATLNYWGTWNYGEFVGYGGIIPLVFALYAIFCRRDKKVFFAIGGFVTALLFSLPTIIANIPYLLQIPFLSSTQPTRLLFIIDFLLAFLAALGVDYYVRNGRKIYVPLIVLTVLMGGLWLFVLGGNLYPAIRAEDIAVAKRNLYLPTIFLVSSMVLVLGHIISSNKKFVSSLVVLLIVVTIFDLFRFFDKFTPFTNKEYLFPQTKTIEFLQSQEKPFRIMSLDSRIMPPNFSTMYRLETIEGYDPLYLRRYGELIAASERGRADISGPFGFNRIITPHNLNSPLINVLNVKYVLSFDELDVAGLVKVFEEGKTKVYENNHVLPRAFFVKESISAENNQDAIEKLSMIDLTNTAVLQAHGNVALARTFASGKIVSSSQIGNTLQFETETTDLGLLIVTSSWYPSLRLKIDNIEKENMLLIANYHFIGIPVPVGKHTITLEYK